MFSQLSISALYPDLLQIKLLSLVWQLLSALAYSLLPFGCASSFLQLLDKNKGKQNFLSAPAADWKAAVGVQELTEDDNFRQSLGLPTFTGEQLGVSRSEIIV